MTETTPVNSDTQKKSGSRKWIIDLCVVLFCVAGAAFSLNLFRLDLYQSLASQNKKPMGTVTVKYNNVQRRFSDRVIWSRLAVESPVYMGDLIRVAEYSAATLSINDGIIDINENSLIRIRASSEGDGGVVIDLGSGSLSMTSSPVSGGGRSTGSTGGSTGVSLSVMGKTVTPAIGATLSASAGLEGLKLQVNEGNVTIKDEGGKDRSINAGEAISLDVKGIELPSAAAVVTQPLPNARFIKNTANPLNIRFAWTTTNIAGNQTLRLEIASGPSFSRIVRTAEGANSANLGFNAGTWYWRISFQGDVLSSGQFTVVDAAISTLLSPIQDSVYRYKEALPSIRFEWQPVEGASSYILEAGLSRNMTKPSITRQSAVAFFVEPNMEAGTWYWRVKPVYSSIYEGSPVYSPVSAFQIVQFVEPVITVTESIAQQTAKSLTTLVLPEPEPVPAVIPAPVKPSPTPPPPPLFSEVTNILPLEGQHFMFEDIRLKRHIDFIWEPVSGANAYIFTLYQKIGSNRKRIFQSSPLRQPEWVLDDFTILDRGTFIWQAEAVSINRNNQIERHGRLIDHTFIIDIPVSGKIEIKNIEIIDYEFY